MSDGPLTEGDARDAAMGPKPSIAEVAAWLRRAAEQRDALGEGSPEARRSDPAQRDAPEPAAVPAEAQTPDQPALDITTPGEEAVTGPALHAVRAKTPDDPSTAGTRPGGAPDEPATAAAVIGAPPSEAPPTDATTEKGWTDDLTTNDLPVDNPTNGGPSTNEAPGDEVPGDEVPGDEVPGDEVDDRVSDDRVSDDRVSDDRVPDDKVPDDKVPDDKVPGDGATTDEVSVVEVPPAETTTGEAFDQDASAGKALTDEPSSEDLAFGGPPDGAPPGVAAPVDAAEPMRSLEVDHPAEEAPDDGGSAAAGGLSSPAPTTVADAARADDEPEGRKAVDELPEAAGGFGLAPGDPTDIEDDPSDDRERRPFGLRGYPAEASTGVSTSVDEASPDGEGQSEVAHARPAEVEVGGDTDPTAGARDEATQAGRVDEDAPIVKEAQELRADGTAGGRAGLDIDEEGARRQPASSGGLASLFDLDLAELAARARSAGEREARRARSPSADDVVEPASIGVDPPDDASPVRTPIVTESRGLDLQWRADDDQEAVAPDAATLDTPTPGTAPKLTPALAGVMKRRRAKRKRYPRGQLRERIGILRRIRAMLGVVVLTVILGVVAGAAIGAFLIFIAFALRSAIVSG